MSKEISWMIGIISPQNKVNQATKAWSKQTNSEQRTHFKGDILTGWNKMSLN